ncbi:site-specific DNA-methyltransferase [Paenarthrobacter sp. RAF54_2]|uniref:site-specific DNA-methyltransferase n=1 Tax=Paenarthrobacter sp. RAF54_2 TaxID=3233061 RepID=UPI003F958AED
MAHLDTLIAMIPDEKLKSEIQHQVNRLTAKTSFGLVFEEHRPESVQLPGFEVTRGGKVVFKDGSTPGIWTVLRLVNGVASIVRVGDAAQRAEASVEELIVIREFGDPIYPGLKSLGKVVRGGDKPFHSIINAENYHATEMLLYPYEGKIDAIYLDPPYNTGAKDWKYNNDYVDADDTYRHSKWLAFMERRLKLAKRLLNPVNSVLIITIDEKEFLRLGLLLEQTFSECEIQMVSSVINPSGSSRQGGFSRTDEYIYFVFVGGAQVVPSNDDMLRPVVESSDVRWDSLVRSGSASNRTDRPNMFYPVFFREVDGTFHSIGKPLALSQSRTEVEPPVGTFSVFPVVGSTEKRWRVSHVTLQNLIQEGLARFGPWSPGGTRRSISYLPSGAADKVRNGEIEVIGKDAEGALILGRTSVIRRPVSTWNKPSHGAADHGSTMLNNLIPGRDFPYPKSLYAVEDALRFFVKDKPHAIVLDFFSGSGTTAHAVMRLNRQDGGRRRSILVTNNEVSAGEQKVLGASGLEPGDEDWESHGIFEHITRPRITAALTGMTPEMEPVKGTYRFNDEFPMSEGFEENVEFFKLTYEDNHLVRLGKKFEAIAPIMWMRAGAQGERIDGLPDDGWALPEDGYYGLLTDIDQWEPFVDAVNARNDIRSVFIVTDSQAEFEAINAQINQGIDSVRLYSDYLQSFEINTRQG